MVEYRLKSKCVIFFALIACHEILLGEGRQLKYKSKESSTKEESQTETGRKRVNLPQNAAGPKEDLQPTEPSVQNIPSVEETVAGKKEFFPPINFGDSAAVSKDDFRPTTPGNSPGVGHKHAKKKEVAVESKVVDSGSLSAGHSVAESRDDFRPTSPGHSPGVGHVLSNKSVEPKA